MYCNVFAANGPLPEQLARRAMPQPPPLERLRRPFVPAPDVEEDVSGPSRDLH